MRALTEAEINLFDALGAVMSGEYANARPAVVNTELDGRDVAVVVAVGQEDDGSYLLTPLAVLVDDDLRERLTPPAESDPA